MYAVVSLWQLPEGRTHASLPEAAIRRARQAPGFVADFWTYERGNGKSFGFMILDSADQAHDICVALECDIETGEQGGAHLEMVRVQQIVVHARAGLAETAC